MSERLQKIMARAGYGSRRSCESLISAGLVKVNGRVAHLGQKADPARDKIEIDGKSIRFPEFVYVMVNKPRGVISSTEDELRKGRKTVRDLVPLPGHLFPVGRLDKQSEGLMLLTNDGALTHRLTHPRYEHDKVYEVQIEGEISNDLIELWEAGLILDGRKTAPAGIQVTYRDRDSTILLITMREGRKRQIRRVAAKLGHPVISLIRRQIGPLELGNLESGGWRHLSSKEISMLLRSVHQQKRRIE